MKRTEPLTAGQIARMEDRDVTLHMLNHPRATAALDRLLADVEAATPTDEDEEYVREWRGGE